MRGKTLPKTVTNRRSEMGRVEVPLSNSGEVDDEDDGDEEESRISSRKCKNSMVSSVANRARLLE